MMSWRCLRVSVWNRRSVDPAVKAIQIPTPATAMCETTMPSSWWASSWLCGAGRGVGGHRGRGQAETRLRPAWSSGSCSRPACGVHTCRRGCGCVFRFVQPAERGAWECPTHPLGSDNPRAQPLGWRAQCCRRWGTEPAAPAPPPVTHQPLRRRQVT